MNQSNAQRNSNNERRAAPAAPVHVVFDVDAAPSRIKLKMGVAEVVLYKTTIDDAVFWVGHPKSTAGEICDKALVVDASGYMTGTWPLQFMAGKAAKLETVVLAAAFKQAFHVACLKVLTDAQRTSVREEIRKDLAEETKLAVVDTAVLREQRDTGGDGETLLYLGGVSQAHLEVAAANGFSFDVQPAAMTVLQRKLGRRFELVSGDWDSKSQQRAMLLGLSVQDVQCLRANLWCLGEAAQQERRPRGEKPHMPAADLAVEIKF